MTCQARCPGCQTEGETNLGICVTEHVKSDRKPLHQCVICGYKWRTLRY